MTNWKARWKKEHGDFAVPCIVSGRWLEFSTGGATWVGEGEALSVAVMTEVDAGNPRKLRDLIITRENLLGVLELRITSIAHGVVDTLGSRRPR